RVRPSGLPRARGRLHQQPEVRAGRRPRGPQEPGVDHRDLRVDRDGRRGALALQAEAQPPGAHMSMEVPFVDLKAQYRSIKAEMDAAVASVIERTEFIGGAELKAFEQKFAEAQGVKH